MVTILIVLSLLFCVPAQAAFAQNTKPLYQLPGKITASAESQTETDVFLVGSDSGLFKVTSSNNVIPLWTEGRVDQISRVNISGQEGWIIRTQKGIFFTEDLKTFSERDNGLPFLTIKKFDGVTPSLTLQIQELKDFCINPLNNNEMVTATKDNVYYSSDAGQNWTSLGSMSKNSPGIKAVAVATIQGETVVFMAHSIFGLSYILPQKPKANWTDIEDGFVKMQSLSSPDEIADILPVVRTNLDGSQYTEIYISQTYLILILVT